MAVFAKPQNDVFALFLLQVIVILTAVRVLGALLAKIKQPRVIGEVIAGLILGPTVLGNIEAYRENVFPEHSLSYLTLISNIGLIFFMFLLGMEVDQKLLQATFKTSIVLSLGSSACSFFVGIGLGAWLYNEKLDPIPIPEHYGGFCLFVGTAISFAAFPILARILTGLGLHRTPMGIKILSCAALDDILGWTTVALVLGYFNGGGVQKGIYTALITAAFVVVVTLVSRYGLTRIAPKSGAANKQFIAIVFLLLCVCALICEILHVHAFFGAFVFGILVPREGNWVQKLIPKLELIVVDFFLPLYFAKLGLRTKLNALDNPKVWLITLVLVLVASVAKLVPVLLLARVFGNDWRTSLTFGVLMNTRGLVALIVVGIAADLNIIGQQVFAMLVLLALITTVITAPILYLLYLKPALDTLPEDQAREKMEQLVPGSTTPPSDTAAGAERAGDQHHHKAHSADPSLAVPLLEQEPPAEPVLAETPKAQYQAPASAAVAEPTPPVAPTAVIVNVVENAPASGPNETPLAPDKDGSESDEETRT